MAVIGVAMAGSESQFLPLPNVVGVILFTSAILAGRKILRRGR